MGLLAQWISQVAPDGDRLLSPGDTLTTNWARRVGWVTECKIVGGDRNRQPGGGRAAGSDSFRIGQGQRLVESL